MLSEFVSSRYDRASGVREYITKISHIVTKLNELKLNISDCFLVHYLVNTLPYQLETFRVSYNTRKDEWTIDDLVPMCEEEEHRQKKNKVEIAHLVIQNKGKKKGAPYGKKKERLQ